MGRINTNRLTFISTISEIVGYKSGVALSRDEISQHLPDYNNYWLGKDESPMLIRYEEYEEVISRLLHAIGNIPNPFVNFPGIAMFHKYKSDPKRLEIYENVMKAFIDQFKNIGNKSSGKFEFNYDGFFDEITKTKYPKLALDMSKELFEEFRLYQHVSPLSLFRQVDWKDEVELNRLFKEEDLSYNHGKFFDQRFIDYLNKNFDSIDKINWRQFEGLVSEYFHKKGYYVEIGRGRNDDNIDARVWPKEELVNMPPTIIIQCKREKEKVGKIVVKALYADILDINSRIGLIVTTNSLSPGAITIRNARSYPIIEINRNTLKKWINKMRSPYTGVFLGT
jgi:restriction system protein